MKGGDRRARRSKTANADAGMERGGTAPAQQQRCPVVSSPTEQRGVNSEVISRVTKEFGFFSLPSGESSGVSVVKTRTSQKSYKVKKGRKKAVEDDPFCTVDDPFPLPPSHDIDDPFPMPHTPMAAGTPTAASSSSSSVSVVGAMTSSSMASIPLPAPNNDLFPMPQYYHEDSSSEEELLGPAAQWREQRKGRRKPLAASQGVWGSADSPRASTTNDSPPITKGGADAPSLSADGTTLFSPTSSAGSLGRGRRAGGGGGGGASAGSPTGKPKLAPLSKPTTSGGPGMQNTSGRPGTSSGRPSTVASSPVASRRGMEKGWGSESPGPKMGLGSSFAVGSGPLSERDSFDYPDYDESSREESRGIGRPTTSNRPSSSRARSPFVSQVYEMGTYKPVNVNLASSTGEQARPTSSTGRRDGRPRSGRPGDREFVGDGLDLPPPSEEDGSTAPRERDRGGGGDRPGTGKTKRKDKMRLRPSTPKAGSAGTPRSKDKTKSPTAPNNAAFIDADYHVSLTSDRSHHKAPEHVLDTAKQSKEKRVRSASSQRKKINRPPSRQRPPPEALHLDLTHIKGGASDVMSPRPRIASSQRKSSPKLASINIDEGLGTLWGDHFRMEDNDGEVYESSSQGERSIEEED